MPMACPALVDAIGLPMTLALTPDLRHGHAVRGSGLASQPHELSRTDVNHAAASHFINALQPDCKLRQLPIDRSRDDYIQLLGRSPSA